jgi:hypothetical protein
VRLTGGLAIIFWLGANAVAMGASDQILRAAYCLRILDQTLAQTRETLTQLNNSAIQHYRTLERQRALTPAERQNYADIQKSVAVDQPAFQRELQNTRNRLAAYVSPALANMSLRGIFSNDISGVYGDALGIREAFQRGEIDFKQCDAEGSAHSAMLCTYACSKQCAGETTCVQGCATRCGTPTCGRTMACLKPTWLPY